MSSTAIHFRTCPLCEATCGLAIEHRGEEVVRIRGDREDVFSHGFICPKGTTLGRLDTDTDLVRTPLVKRNGRHVPATWEEAFSIISERLSPLVAEHGPDSLGVYLGNPNVHSLSGILYVRPFVRMLRTKSVFSASTVDQMPKHLSAGLMFGHPDLIPIPDIDHTDYLLILGANPFESNGSLATAPDWPGRMKAILERDGKVVVVDPRQTRTARAATEHVAIRPGTDALLLAAMANVLIDEGLVELGRLSDIVDGFDRLETAVAGFEPEAVAPATSVPPDTIRRLARELAAAPTAAVYGRVGTHTTEFGSLASWLVDVLNVLTGNLDRPGGAMFPMPAHEQPRARRGFVTGRWSSRVSGRPEVRGELPVSVLAEEILEPGAGRIRALITVAGNPVLSTPDSDRLAAALSALDFMVAIDLYLNETTRHADVVLPGTSPLRRSHYDLAFYQLSVRNIAHYSPPLFERPEGHPDEWEVLLRVAAAVNGQGHKADVDSLDEAIFATLVGTTVANPASTIHGRDPEEIFTATDGGPGPERLLDFLLRTGPYGEGYGANPSGLTLASVRNEPHGIDLGPLQPRFPEALCTTSGRIELAPESLVADLPRLRAGVERITAVGMTLVGRRDIRSNNSWMHNLEVLVRGKTRCTAQIHPDDAERLSLVDGGEAKVTSAAGTLVATVEITDEVMPGVVSLPHGWGHHLEGTELSVASKRPGVNFNLLSTGAMDPLSGNAVLNGIEVDVVPA